MRYSHKPRKNPSFLGNRSISRDTLPSLHWAAPGNDQDGSFAGFDTAGEWPVPERNTYPKRFELAGDISEVNRSPHQDDPAFPDPFIYRGHIIFLHTVISLVFTGHAPLTAFDVQYVQMKRFNLPAISLEDLQPGFENCTGIAVFPGTSVYTYHLHMITPLLYFAVGTVSVMQFVSTNCVRRVYLVLNLTGNVSGHTGLDRPGAL